MDNRIITDEMLDWARTPDNIRDKRSDCHAIFVDAETERNAANQPYHNIETNHKTISAKDYIDRLVFRGLNIYKRHGAYGRLTSSDNNWDIFQFDKRDKIGKRYAEMVCRRRNENN